MEKTTAERQRDTAVKALSLIRAWTTDRAALQSAMDALSKIAVYAAMRAADPNNEAARAYEYLDWRARMVADDPRVRELRNAAIRASASAKLLIAELLDPGTEALAAIYELDRVLAAFETEDRSNG